ncbi:TraR/DksA C4-type zinc finger protein [Mameliella alba]|nr:TraR/DksA C4-type zinc finger protein [Antarctobacter heliothermus]MBY6145708.1 TraR/DksA C4-type zinc finger protein [Mameliella alba]
MDESEIARFRRQIAVRLIELDDEDARGREGQSTVQLDQQAVGCLSRQDALLNQSMAKATQARRDALRRALRTARDRIDSGTFGYCEECGDSIAPKRLDLDPAAIPFISCASG